MYSKTILIGRLGVDPKLVITQNQKSVCSFTIATTEKFGDPPKEKTEWHSIVVWGKSAEACSKYLEKGSLVGIEGKIQSRSWDDKEGHKKYKTEIMASDVKFLSPKRKDDQLENAPAATQSYDDLMDVPF